jgi:hypothetical protein
VIGTLLPNQPVTLLQREQVYQGMVWLEVVDADGRVGWVPWIYLATHTPTRTPSATATP